MKTAVLIVLVTASLAAAAAAAAEQPTPKNINDYLVDITGGAVSALGIVGGDKSGIVPIETSQDLVVAIQPFTSSGNQKTSFGLAITPAKTSIVPMSGVTYSSERTWPLWALLGNLTASYAENRVEIGRAFRKTGYSLNTVAYFDRDDDPVFRASTAFKRCADAAGKAHEDAIDALNKRRLNNEIDPGQFAVELAALVQKRADLLTPCIDADLKALAAARWNAGRLSASFGEGRIRGVDGVGSYSLGRSYNLNALAPVGRNGALQVSLRSSRGGIDPDTLRNPTPAAQSSRLAALRYTYGDAAGNDFRVFAEISTSNRSAAGAYRDVFQHAVGFDKWIMQGAWLEFRVGRNRTFDSAKEQTTSLLGVNIAPTLFGLKK